MVAIRNIVLVVVCVALVLAGSGYWWAQKTLQQPLVMPTALVNTDEPALVEIPAGSHLRSVLQILHEQGYLPGSVQHAYYALRVFTPADSIQAGVYAIEPHSSLISFWSQVTAGRAHLFQVTLIEGQNWSQWVEVLRQAAYLDHSLLEQSEAQILSELGLSDYARMEGLLLPETYTYKAYTSATTVLRKAAVAMQTQLSELWANRDRDLPYATPYELLIMASIIEKETGVKAERARVSSVFVNRLRLGMRLQSDPTTIYGIENFDGNLTRAHLRTETPYNTYRIPALPPTPIAMPSKASLVAAANPETTDYLYFVADGSGGHIFSRTLAEHNRAVNRYQRGIN
ncbi:endolytic transglycosylase MltG [Pseudidiomarina aestuarii]|uniref:Endolytic murein transglycosylase n=1 Tax=Pseudidiomarina aestuarii TaxID=624146 RepID=A0A7Z6ZTP8_9GAMM|nr:endolytic transglycosylase MltG [Pseudidiomarina aestuarii]RUO41133.1 endolytic transglycosylase MltG [Pseudidiomarina aestuarii]